MHDELRPELDALEALDGAAPPLFRRVLIAGDGQTARADACALAGQLAGRGQKVTARDTADLIVLGSASTGAPDRTSLDQAGKALIEGAPAPVAVAPRGYSARGPRTLGRIDIGIDGGRDAGAALALAGRLAGAADARLRPIAVAEPRDERAADARGADPRELERLGRHLEHAADGLPGIWVETELCKGLPGEVLIGFAGDTDLLVLGSRSGYGGAGCIALGALAETVLASSPAPVLIVPAP